MPTKKTDKAASKKQPTPNKMSADDIREAVRVLALNSVKPDANGQYEMYIAPDQLEHIVISLVRELPPMHRELMEEAFTKIDSVFSAGKRNKMKFAVLRTAICFPDQFNTGSLFADAVFAIETNTKPLPYATATAFDVAKMIEEECDELKTLLLAKNEAYGNSALEPVRVFSKASAKEQLLVRIDDKLSRIAKGKAAGEDVTKDLLGYLILLRIAERMEREGR